MRHPVAVIHAHAVWRHAAHRHAWMLLISNLLLRLVLLLLLLHGSRLWLLSGGPLLLLLLLLPWLWRQRVAGPSTHGRRRRSFRS
jgi:hypothetical protein